MSYTTIYFLKEKELLSAEFRNSHRGAMYIWRDEAKRYFGLDMFPFFDDDEQMKIWNYGNHNPHTMPMHEQIALLSTMDGALMEPARWTELVEAFEKYGEEHPNSSFGEQASAIREFMESDKSEGLVAIGWNQTSVCGDVRWFDHDEEDELFVYDPASGNDHFFIMSQIDGNLAGEDALP